MNLGLGLGLGLALGSAGGGVAPLTGFTDLTVAGSANYFLDATTATLTGSAPNQYYNKGSLARVSLVTSDTSLTIEAVSTGLNLNDKIGIHVNGVLYQTVTFAVSATKQQTTITLPAGSKVVDITDNAFLTGVSATSYTLVTKPVSVPKRYAVYGDSITVTVSGNSAMTMYTLLLRYCGRFDATVINGQSGSSLFGDTGNGGSVNALAAQLVALCSDGVSERVLYIEKGTNDYGQNAWTAAAFGTSLAALCDQVHALDPTIKIVLQTLFHRSTLATGASVIEGANGLGSSWADFNTQITSVASTRTAFINLIDGSQAWTLAQITADGGLHPGVALNVQAFNYVREQLGQINPASSSLTVSSTTLLTAPPTTLKSKLRADTGITSTGASPDKITAITDIGSLGSTWVQRAAGSGPEKTTVGGKAAILYTTAVALESLHTTLGVANWGFLGNAGFTGIWRIQRASATDSTVIDEINASASSSNGLFVQLTNSTRSILTRVSNGSGTFCYSVTSSSNAIPVAGTTFTLDIRFTQAGGLIVRVNKTVVATGATVGTLSSSASSAFVPESGARAGGNPVGANMYLFEQQLYGAVAADTALDDATLNALVDQMATDWP